MNDKIPIFIDFGGTLVDTIEITRLMFKKALNRSFSNEQIIKMYKEASSRRMSMMLFFKYPVNPIKLMLNKKKLRRIQEELFLNEVKLHPKAKETLEKIKKHGEFTLILVTQNPTMEDEEQSKQIIKKLFGNKNPFELILAGEDKTTMISNHFNTESISKGIFIGDLPNDILNAEMLGIPCIGVTWGYSSESELETPYIAEDFEELYELVIDHLEDLKEDSAEEELEEIEFEEEINGYEFVE
ncbi:MAG: HAD hydrolase-like protein [Candidatus Heimdallarchaeota archaeon]|nr:HAD hydrolase-like protein [Candidatus Heimdallarchaeota archaeon]MCK4770451.1 HAD hydrolase-like protein [Candidatus Heimdallarchaeota archaeon]